MESTENTYFMAKSVDPDHDGLWDAKQYSMLIGYTYCTDALLILKAKRNKYPLGK
jgi:hypothetical protein